MVARVISSLSKTTVPPGESRSKSLSLDKSHRYYAAVTCGLARTSLALGLSLQRFKFL